MFYFERPRNRICDDRVYHCIDCAPFNYDPNLLRASAIYKHKRRMPLLIALDSYRIWEESPKGIRFVKHRWAQGKVEDEPVDLKEFMWVKLSAIQIE